MYLAIAIKSQVPQARNFVPGLQSFSRGIFLLPVRRGNTNRDSKPLGLSTYNWFIHYFPLLLNCFICLLCADSLLWEINPACSFFGPANIQVSASQVQQFVRNKKI
ncbi:hypothetical protein HYPSUDRAFT_32206 [Hypholoma sublateritium FD-334 SS-4]|uniref:Uncharacterized protein n=1 Tax=Hypholoma sublateritium (strain FD-334 SS-4) TaxID=945553 RepID=A0A0D2LPT3_HYPSF|nr:hypothetical protein HYPSUDRAFT_32206 [Hypholoma sublateritium FD-334 SS-4]